jgi:hypothetical protein
VVVVVLVGVVEVEVVLPSFVESPIVVRAAVVECKDVWLEVDEKLVEVELEWLAW